MHDGAAAHNLHRCGLLKNRLALCGLDAKA